MWGFLGGGLGLDAWDVDAFFGGLLFLAGLAFALAAALVAGRLDAVVAGVFDFLGLLGDALDLVFVGAGALVGLRVAGLRHLAGHVGGTQH